MIMGIPISDTTIFIVKYDTGKWVIFDLSQFQWNNPDGYGKIHKKDPINIAVHKTKTV